MSTAERATARAAAQQQRGGGPHQTAGGSQQIGAKPQQTGGDAQQTGGTGDAQQTGNQGAGAGGGPSREELIEMLLQAKRDTAAAVASEKAARRELAAEENDLTREEGEEEEVLQLTPRQLKELLKERIKEAIDSDPIISGLRKTEDEAKVETAITQATRSLIDTKLDDEELQSNLVFATEMLGESAGSLAMLDTLRPDNLDQVKTGLRIRLARTAQLAGLMTGAARVGALPVWPSHAGKRAGMKAYYSWGSAKIKAETPAPDYKVPAVFEVEKDGLKHAKGLVPASLPVATYAPVAAQQLPPVQPRRQNRPQGPPQQHGYSPYARPTYFPKNQQPPPPRDDQRKSRRSG